MPYKCFLIQPSGISVVELCLQLDICDKSPYEPRRHFFEAEVFRGPSEDTSRFFNAGVIGKSFDGVCRYCGEKRKGLSSSSGSCGPLWTRMDTGETKRRTGDFGIGAMWFATWYDRRDPGGQLRYGWDFDNQLDPPLIVATPDGDWNVDARASNCTMPMDRLHRCWVRHGAPPEITVDKAGLTCAAGGGSIQKDKYHGFLRNGYLTDGC